MATRKQPRGAGAPSRAGAAAKGGKSRDRGTRGGRPDAQAAAAAGRRQGNGRAGGGRPGNGQVPGNGRAAARRPPPPPTETPAADAGRVAPLWLQMTSLVLSVAGLGVSVYLTIAHYNTSVTLACPDTGLVNCGKVTSSAESVVLGIPVAVLGLAFFVFMVAANSPWAWRAQRPEIGWARLGSLIVGMVFVLYLVYTELFTLDAICLWCTSVHVITFGLFALVMFAVAAGYIKTPSRR
jgi:uncharacterized membrane protein